MRQLLICCLVVAQLVADQEPRRSPRTSSNLSVEKMVDDALAMFHPYKRAGLIFERGSFSPDGTFFAMTVSNIRSGDPEQVWLYDLRSKRLSPVTEEPPIDPRRSIQIRDMTWSDDETLYISALRIKVTAQMYLVAATRNNTNEISSLPFEISNAFAQLDGSTARYGLRKEQDGHYIVAVTNRGHGDIMLTMRPGIAGPTRMIARAGWELQSFLFARDRSEVLFPSADTIIAFNLQTGESRAALRGTGRDLRLLGRSGDGRVVAYTVSGPCVSGSGDTFSAHQSRNVCFARVE